MTLLVGLFSSVPNGQPFPGWLMSFVGSDTADVLQLCASQKLQVRRSYWPFGLYCLIEKDLSIQYNIILVLFSCFWHIKFMGSTIGSEDLLACKNVLAIHLCRYRDGAIGIVSDLNR